MCGVEVWHTSNLRLLRKGEEKEERKQAGNYNGRI